MVLTKEDIARMEKIPRLNLINAISGIKPANLIGTISEDGLTNLAIFSSVVHLGSNPAQVGMIVRPATEVNRHTYENIRATGVYTINHVHRSFTARAHYTSAKFERHTSEFEVCGLTEEYLEGFSAPFVQESRIKMGMGFIEEIPIRSNGTILIIGEVKHLIIPEDILDSEGHPDLTITDNVGISGLNTYYALERIAQYPYARPHELPDFDRL